MSFTQSFGATWIGNGESLSAQQSVTADATDNRDITVSDGATQLVALTLDVSQLQGCFLLSDHACALKTNDSGSPAATINLTANVPAMWTQIQGGANPFGAVDVTSLYIVNSAGAAAFVRIRLLVDATV